MLIAEMQRVVEVLREDVAQVLHREINASQEELSLIEMIIAFTTLSLVNGLTIVERDVCIFRSTLIQTIVMNVIPRNSKRRVRLHQIELV